MNPVVLMFIFACGLSCGILLGRHDERRKTAATAAAGRAMPQAVAPAPAAAVLPDPGAPVPLAADPAAPAAAPPAAPAPAPPPDLEPAVAAAMGILDPLEPVQRTVAEPNKKAKRAGIDTSAFTMRDDILERLRRAEEIGVQPEAVRDLLADPPAPKVPALERDPDLAERERRILERLAEQAPPPDDASPA